VEVRRPGSAGSFEGAAKFFLHLQATGGRIGAVLGASRAGGVRHARAERLVRDGGLEWPLLRPDAFSATSLRWPPRIRGGGTVRGPFAGAVTAPIHEDDIAAAAERALLDAGHDGAVHRLTGPEAATDAGQVATVGRVLGRDPASAEVPARTAEADLLPGLPRQVVRAVPDSFAAMADSGPEITSTVEEVTGRPARTSAAWAEDHRADFTA
jgi:uncharacterized protein YbjT (DUF2867 family)